MQDLRERDNTTTGTIRSVHERDLMADTWVATDALGRPLPTADEVGPPRRGRVVGLFYLTWLGAHGHDTNSDPALPGQGVQPKEPGRKYKSPYNITEILAASKDDPINSPLWGPVHAYHHWAEPELGYYVSDDEFVIRRHGQLLGEVGVDVLILDTTNGYTYRDTYLTICRVFQQMRDAGIRVPKIAFFCNTRAPETVQKLFDEFYARNLYPEMWFYWKGKPLLLSPSEGLNSEFLDFFTIRQTWAWSDPNGWFKDGKDKWTFLDHSPQRYGWHESPDRPEQISVTVAQHPVNDINVGRSHQNGKQPAAEDCRTEQGIYFAEQWKRALEVDPEFIFICGWNEWIAMRFVSNGIGPLIAGRKPVKGESFFIDEYTQEYSRDIEPMKGGHTDNYFYQMVANIRRYKGARPLPAASAPKTIRIEGGFSQWDDVEPEYRDATGDTMHRDHMGWGRFDYRDATGRNNIIASKVARDEEYVYFYAETADPLTDFHDPHWMLLFIDADADTSTGWEGYDYLVNEPVIDAKRTSIKRAVKDADGKWQWEKVGEAEFHTKGNQLHIAIPRRMLGLPEGEGMKIDFHWADNIQKLGDIIEFSLHGDSAPDRRFNYRFFAK